MDKIYNLQGLGHRFTGRGKVLLGLSVLFSCVAFFGFDVVFEFGSHLVSGISYSPGELVHLVFEVIAVFGLGYAITILWAYLRLLQVEAERSQETIHMLRGNFDDVLLTKFNDWGLTTAERDVTLLIMRGLSVAEIAAARNTAQGTIKAQSTSVFRKVGVKSKTDLMSLIIDEFITSDQPLAS